MEHSKVDIGDMSDIPPDAPDGEWQAVCSVKERDNKDGFKMLIITWTLEEDRGGGDNAAFEGSRVTDFLVFYPASHANSRMTKIRFRAMREALDLPNMTSLDDLPEFVNELEGKKAIIWTKVNVQKDGQKRTNVFYTAPRGSLTSLSSSRDEDEEVKAPPAKKLKKKSA